MGWKKGGSAPVTTAALLPCDGGNAPVTTAAAPPLRRQSRSRADGGSAPVTPTAPSVAWTGAAPRPAVP
ncbi:hypothetical protein GCM10010228_14980 [Streptomyces massasporeus]|nr:hypothetical protein GCM10010228_14980 [Streptomyces massasporeus]